MIASGYGLEGVLQWWGHAFKDKGVRLKRWQREVRESKFENFFRFVDLKP